jgi:hypothetical protein
MTGCGARPILECRAPVVEFHAALGAVSSARAFSSVFIACT